MRNEEFSPGTPNERPTPAAGTPVRRGARYRRTDPVVALKGLGPRWANELGELGVNSVGDLLNHLPTKFQDRRHITRIADLEPGEGITIVGTVNAVRNIRTRRRGLSMFRVTIDDGTFAIDVVFFNRSYLGEWIKVGRVLLVHGNAKRARGKLEIHSPDFELINEGVEPSQLTGWTPSYPKLGPLTGRRLRTVLREAVDGIEVCPDPVPNKILEDLDLIDRDRALREIHVPCDETRAGDVAARATPAHRRLAFDEFFTLELGLAMRKARLRKRRGPGGYAIDEALRLRLAKLLPFKLTAAQMRVLEEIGEDLRASWPMHRLLLGDVGSGKTVVAALAMLVAAENGYQAALMAPTEILARQHFASLHSLLCDAGHRLDLLTASMSAKQQQDVRVRLATGDTRLVVGTHSLVSKKVEFAKLGLAVIDEQHRFGVVQRADLVAKGRHPDLLVMSATPIPRTLAMVSYGDLDLSVIDEKPPGRQPIKTVVRTADQRRAVFESLGIALAQKHQVFVVRPAVAESERGMRAVADGVEEYTKRFPQARVGHVHGKMAYEERSANIAAFASGDLDILVATTVIEVGIDVPGASVILVEDAERFGLAQLHQLRGRVGRGKRKSYCVLVAGENASKEALERLDVLASCSDGFEVAERDLAMRGPGEVAGTAQSGAPSFKVADIVRHRDLLIRARDHAFALLERVGEDGLPPQLREEIYARHGERLRLADIG